MTLQEIKQKVSSDEYSFLKINEHLGKNIILLGLGGSYAYGTNIDTSDIDIRGVALNRKQEILTNIKFEQFINVATDTTIYSFNKIIALLTNCNPNTIELLGLRPEHYLYISNAGHELLVNKKMFLSKKSAYTFGGYATSQLRRLDNKSAKLVGQEQGEIHVLNSILNAIELGKLGKHMMHLIRLYMMCLDILEKEEIVTYRENEHDLLMDIRNGKYLDSNRKPIPEFFEMVSEFEKRLDYAKANTSLPDNPNYKLINEFIISVNEDVVLGNL